MGEQRQNHKIARDVELEKVARVGAPESSKNPENSPQNQWAALRAALQSVEKIPKSQILVQLYRSARTYFIKNC